MSHDPAYGQGEWEMGTRLRPFNLCRFSVRRSRPSESSRSLAQSYHSQGLLSGHSS